MEDESYPSLENLNKALEKGAIDLANDILESGVKPTLESFKIAFRKKHIKIAQKIWKHPN